MPCGELKTAQALAAEFDSGRGAAPSPPHQMSSLNRQQAGIEPPAPSVSLAATPGITATAPLQPCGSLNYNW